MATRQYIGARYVIKIYENSQTVGSAEWEAGTSYEPLTLVTYQNSSYLSKKDVPPTVGNPATNGSYWAQTGYYNGQISNLQNEVSNLQNQIGNLTNLTTTNKDNVVEAINEIDDDTANIYIGQWLHGKNVVVYGDSTITTESINYVSYMETVAQAANFNLTNRSVGGTKMNDGTNSGVSLINAATDLTSFDYCFLAYGTNEWQSSLSAKKIKGDVDAIISALQTKAPNIGIIFITPFYSYNDFNSLYSFGACNNARGMSIKKVGQLIKEQLEDLDIPYIDLYKRSTCNAVNYTSKLLNDSGGIYVHPNAEFKKEIAQIVLQGAMPTPTKNYVSIFGNLDFLAGRNAIEQTTDLTNANGIYYNGSRSIGITVKITNSIIPSSVPHLIQERYKYRLRGAANGNCTLHFNSASATDVRPAINILNGDFDIDLDIPTGFIIFTIESASDVVLNDFQLYVESEFNDIVTTNYFSEPMGATLSSGITANVHPTIQFHKDGLLLPTFDITLANNLTNGALVFTFTNKLVGNVYPNYITGYAADGSRCLLQIVNNKAYVIGTAAANTYFFGSNMLYNHEINAYF